MMVHTFSALGQYLAADVNSGAVHVLDRLSYDLLNLLDGPVGEGRGVPPELLEKIPPERREALRGVLSLDPRPRYQEDPERVYGFGFAGLEVRFSVEGEVLRVREILEGVEP